MGRNQKAVMVVDYRLLKANFGHPPRFYAEGVIFQSPGSRLAAHPGGAIPQSNVFTLKALHNIVVQPLRGRCLFELYTQGGAAAPLTLGFGL
jgi:hypothetical protein